MCEVRTTLERMTQTIRWIRKKMGKAYPADLYIAEKCLIFALDDLRIANEKKAGKRILLRHIRECEYRMNNCWEVFLRYYLRK